MASPARESFPGRRGERDAPEVRFSHARRPRINVGEVRCHFDNSISPNLIHFRQQCHLLLSRENGKTTSVWVVSILKGGWSRWRITPRPGHGIAIAPAGQGPISSQTPSQRLTGCNLGGSTSTLQATKNQTWFLLISLEKCLIWSSSLSSKPYNPTLVYPRPLPRRHPRHWRRRLPRPCERRNSPHVFSVAILVLLSLVLVVLSLASK